MPRSNAHVSFSSSLAKARFVYDFVSTYDELMDKVMQ